MILSGAIFVTGAVGFEMLSGMHAAQHGQETVTYGALATIEEVLEKFGIALFIYTLLLYLGSQVQRLEVALPVPAERRRQPPSTAAAAEVRTPEEAAGWTR